MSSGGGGTNTVTQNSAPPQQFMDAYQKLIQGAQNQASAPLQQYAGPMVAGFSPDQEAAFQTVRNAQGITAPYINAGATALGNATQPLWGGINQLDPSQLRGAGATGMGLVNSAGNTNIAAAGQPGANYATSGAGSGITAANAAANTDPSQVSAYFNPFLNSAVAATQASFANQNAQTNQGIVSNAIKSGAWGGDRAGVAQGIAAGQEQLAQAPVIAGMESQGYQQAQAALQAQNSLRAQTALGGAGLSSTTGLGIANLGQQAAGQTGALQAQAGSQLFNEFSGQQQAELGANEANAWLNSQAGFGIANLGLEAQNSALSGAQAEMGIGGMEQALGQEQLNVPFSQFQQQQAYPYQQLSWLGGLTGGLGAGAGGSSVTSSPGPSVLSQLTGLGMSGIGIAGATGGFGSGGWLSGILGSGAGAGLGAGVLEGGAAAAGGSEVADAALAIAALAKRGGRIMPHRADGGGILIPFPRSQHRGSGGGIVPANDDRAGGGEAVSATGTYGRGIVPHFAGGGMAGLDSGAASDLVRAELGGGGGPGGAFRSSIDGDLGNVGFLANKAGVADAPPVGGIMHLGTGEMGDLVRGELGGGSGTAGSFSPGASGDLGNIGFLANRAGVQTGQGSPAASGIVAPAGGAPGRSAITTKSMHGLAIPQLDPSQIIGRPDMTPHADGSPAWMNPLPQYRPPGTTSATDKDGNISVTFPHNTIALPKGITDAINPPPPATTEAPKTDPEADPTPAPRFHDSDSRGGRVHRAGGGIVPRFDIGGDVPVYNNMMPSGLPDREDQIAYNGPSVFPVDAAPDGTTIGIPREGGIRRDDEPVGPGSEDTAAEPQAPASARGIIAGPPAPPAAAGAPLSAAASPTVGAGIVQRPDYKVDYQPRTSSGAGAEALHQAPWMALIQAGLATAAGRSPNALTNIGAGGMKGVEEYGKLRREGTAEQEKEAEAIDSGNYRKGSLDMQAQHFSDTIEDARKKTQQQGEYQTGELAIRNREAGIREQEQRNTQAYRDAELGIRRDTLEQGKYTVQPGMGPDPGDESKQVQGAWKINTKDGTSEFVPGMTLTNKLDPTASALTPSDPSMHGEDYLKTLPSGTAAQIKAIAEGRMAIPSGFALKSPYWQGMMTAVSQYDPEFSAQRLPALKAFMIGKEGQTVRSLSVATAHLNTLDQLGDALSNGNVQLLNQAKQAWNKQFGSPAPTNFELAKQIVADEVVKAVMGSGAGSAGDRERLQEQFSKANSPAQLKGAIQTAKTLMGGQLKGLQNQYEVSTGHHDFTERFLTSEARAALAPEGGAGGGQEGLPSFANPAEAMKLPSGSAFYAVMPDGSKKLKYVP